MEVTHLLSGAMIALGKKATTIEEGVEKSKEAIRNGRAYAKFIELVRAQGGDITTIDNFDNRMPQPRFCTEVRSIVGGYVNEIDSLELGLASIALGASREKIDDVIDPKAGIKLNQKVGNNIRAGDSLAVFYTDRETGLESARTRIANAFHISSRQPKSRSMILDIVDSHGVREWKS
jgi:pyrimidine-nucleoside phosphorylase